MDEPSRPYQPIACDFHDRLEAYATLRRRVRLSLKDAEAPDNPSASLTAEGRIADLYTTSDKREFLRLDNGAEIRLDRIVGIEPVE